MKPLFIIFSLIVSVFSSSLALAKDKIERVEPAFWWAGMRGKSLQLLVHGKEIGRYNTVTAKYDGLVVKQVDKAESPNYLFVTLELDNKIKAGKFPISFSDGKKTITYEYELKERIKDGKKAQGFSQADLMYMLMPDRFANGNPSNDNADGMIEKADRKKPFGRHGGDLKGIAEHLDYIKELGTTALWLNPVLENNQPSSSYHGYAITDFYRIDPRFGSNEDYVAFSERARKMDIKMIMDMVFNHIGTGHWWMKDLPFKDWLNQHEQYTNSNFRISTVLDPHAAKADQNVMVRGWFDKSMPDLNQQNKFLANYLIQNSLWWIEYASLDGIRMDTYPYPDKNFMADWCKAVRREYPRFTIVGEVWVNNPSMEAYWLTGSRNTDRYHGAVPSVTDFPLYYAIAPALNNKDGEGLERIYNVISQDYLYMRPENNLIFTDNHDLGRFFNDVGRNLDKFKMGMAFLLTTRGVPQIYYGTELLMDGNGNPHPNVRKDVLGGWEKDSVNQFTEKGRTPQQNEAFNFIKKLGEWRKNKDAIHKGKLVHFTPSDNIYVYFRYTPKEKVMVIMNGNTSEKSLDTKRFAEELDKYKKGKEVISGQEITDISKIILPPLSTQIFELE
jgi:glycosidase